MWILVVGNISEGLDFIGPFKTDEAALDYGEAKFPEHYFAVKVDPPEEEGE